MKRISIILNWLGCALGIHDYDYYHTNGKDGDYECFRYCLLCYKQHEISRSMYDIKRGKK